MIEFDKKVNEQSVRECVLRGKEQLKLAAGGFLAVCWAVVCLFSSVTISKAHTNCSQPVAACYVLQVSSKLPGGSHKGELTTVGHLQVRCLWKV